MNKTFWNLLLVSPAMLGMSAIVSATAIAQEAPTASETTEAAKSQPSELTVTESIKIPETLTLNTSVSPVEQLAAIPKLEPAAEVTTTVTPLEIGSASQISENFPQISPIQATPEKLAQVPANQVQMGGPILPASPSAQSNSQKAQSSNAMGQVTSVSQLSDVQPTDWAFQALQSLVERYGCIAGYPDGTFRGNRALTRYEFAAGLNACLDQVSRLIATATANFVTKEDLAILQRLQEEFAAELATLRGRVDALEARTTELEANQFSTTTKLAGEAIFAISDTYQGDISLNNKDNNDDDPTETNLGYRVRLNLLTSFTGRDLLKTRLQARNVAEYQKNTAAGTNMARLAFDGESGNTFTLDELYYRFPAGRATVFIGPTGLNLDTITPVITPFNSSGTGSVSRFGQRNPNVYRGADGAGIGINYDLSKSARATIAYLAANSDAPDPSDGRGLFTGSYSALAQLAFSLGDKFDVGLTYTHKYYRSGAVTVSGGTGSSLANRPFGNVATSSDDFGIQVNFKPSKSFNLGGWFGYTRATQERGGDDKATILNGAITLAFPDLGRRGNLLGFIVGVPPKVTSSDGAEDDATSLHVEGFYRLQVTDFISITPAVYMITNPEHNEDNDTIWVGVLRTTFSF
ncbi:porin [Oscillatoriales cyanobacterium USR001]|nr:porin [Oscillatoriales cyanobacterium USR001]